eukprot:TRINITY_DN3490_c0_g2_i12.p1 TRINITY_DN3490_c0_g2~~TRINITY_DN3490_c0_g2_i12.p1  ORF type:complete len:119 (+),score=13.97 TRINITY_DN3490_c0_g2_i12:313-669(+)
MLMQCHIVCTQCRRLHQSNMLMQPSSGSEVWCSVIVCVFDSINPMLMQCHIVFDSISPMLMQCHIVCLRLYQSDADAVSYCVYTACLRLHQSNMLMQPSSGSEVWCSVIVCVQRVSSR